MLLHDALYHLSVIQCMQWHKSYPAYLRPFKCYVMQSEVGGWRCQISRKKHYEDKWFNVVSVPRDGCVLNFRYVALEWPLSMLVCVV